MAPSLRLAALLTFCCTGTGLESTNAQITQVKLGDLSGLCPVSTKAVNILPGNFSRGILQPFTATQLSDSDNDINSLANCQFLSFDPSFDVLLGTNRTFYQLGPNATSNYAFEGPVYLPETDEVFFVSEFTGNLSRVSLASGQVTAISLEDSVGGANGATNYMGQVALTTFGAVVQEGLPTGVMLLDPYNGTWSYLINNWFGLRFDGPDDIVALSDGSLIFTDTGYSVQLDFNPMPNQVQFAVYIVPPTGPARVLIDGFPGVTYTGGLGTPNGVALSPDQQTLYVSVTVLALQSTPDEQFINAHSIYAYDLVQRNGGYFALNARVFCSLDVGIPDGFKVDSAGNIFTSSGDGIQVFNPAGSLIGKIIIPDASVSPQLQGVNNLVFAGDRLVIMHHTNILMLPLNTTGALLG